MKNIMVVVVVLIVAGVAFAWYQTQPTSKASIPATSFDECVSMGNAVMESFPRQCNDALGNHFVEEVPGLNTLSYTNATPDIITVATPVAGSHITSPIVITGEARGYWFFEASFPVMLTDWDGKIIAQGVAQAQSDWMTEDFVSYTATLEFETPTYGERGTLILQKDNPSALPENDAAVEVPVFFNN